MIGRVLGQQVLGEPIVASTKILEEALLGAF